MLLLAEQQQAKFSDKINKPGPYRCHINLASCVPKPRLSAEGLNGNLMHSEHQFHDHSISFHLVSALIILPPTG